MAGEHGLFISHAIKKFEMVERYLAAAIAADALADRKMAFQVTEQNIDRVVRSSNIRLVNMEKFLSMFL